MREIGLMPFPPPPYPIGSSPTWFAPHRSSPIEVLKAYSSIPASRRLAVLNLMRALAESGDKDE